MFHGVHVKPPKQRSAIYDTGFGTVWWKKRAKIEGKYCGVQRCKEPGPETVDGSIKMLFVEVLVESANRWRLIGTAGIYVADDEVWWLTLDLSPNEFKRNSMRHCRWILHGWRKRFLIPLVIDVDSTTMVWTGGQIAQRTIRIRILGRFQNFFHIWVRFYRLLSLRRFLDSMVSTSKFEAILTKFFWRSDKDEICIRKIQLSVWILSTRFDNYTRFGMKKTLRENIIYRLTLYIYSKCTIRVHLVVYSRCLVNPIY